MQEGQDGGLFGTEIVQAAQLLLHAPPQSFQESARKKPLRGKDLYYLGMSQLRMGQDTESRKTLEKALSAGLQEPMLHDARAVIADLQRRSQL